MNDWNAPTFSTAPLEIIDGDRGANYPPQSEFKTHDHCLFLNANNVTRNGFDFATVAFISKERDELLRKGKLQRHDIVLTTRGTVGNSAFFDDFVPHQHVRINSGMVILRTNREKIVPRYLYLILKIEGFFRPGRGIDHWQCPTAASDTRHFENPCTAAKGFRAASDCWFDRCTR